MREIQTKRLVLKPVSKEHAPFFLTIMNEPAYHQNIGDRGVRTLEQMEVYLEERVLSPAKRNGFGMWAVSEMAVPESTIGFAGLISRPEFPDIDIGYAFLTKHWGKGFASEACLPILDFARHQLKLKRVTGYVNDDNLGSIRVLEKLGLKFEKRITMPGETKTIRQYGIDF